VAKEKAERREDRLRVHEVMCQDLGVPAELQDKVCRIYLQRHECKYSDARCHRIHWHDTALLRWLSARNLCTFEVAHLCCRDRLATVDDLAFRFTSFDEANSRQCGEAWAATQHDGTAGIHTAAAEVVDLIDRATPKFSEEARPKSRPCPLKGPKLQGLRRAKAPSTHGAESQSQDIEARRKATTELADLAALWLEPVTACWLEEKARLVERLILRKFEANSMRAVLVLWNKHLAPWCRSRQLDPLKLSPGQLEDFINENKSTITTQPRTRFEQLQWLRRHLKCPLPDIDDRKPPIYSSDLKQSKEQAVEAELETVFRLERFVKPLEMKKDWRLGAVLAALVLWMAGMRFRHIQRSSFVARTILTMRLICYRGKTGVASGCRVAFKWRLPRAGLVSKYAMDLLWRLWHQFSEIAGTPLQFLCFDTNTGISMSANQFTQAIREVAQLCHAVDAPSALLLTGYSFRRAGTTGLGVWGAPWSQRCDFAGWRDISSAANDENTRVNLMPAVYDGRKGESEEWVKLFQLAICGAQFEDMSTDIIATWDSMRAWCKTIEGSTLMQTLAASVSNDMKVSLERDFDVAYGASEEAVRQLNRRIRVPPRQNAAASSSSKIDLAAPDEAPDVLPIADMETDPSSNDSESDSDSDQTDPMKVVGLSPIDRMNMTPWVFQSSPNSKIHVTDEPWSRVPVCHVKTGHPLAGQVEDGIGLEILMRSDRSLCKHCFTRLDEELRVWLSQSGIAPP
jgi:hypothetical protein